MEQNWLIKVEANSKLCFKIIWLKFPLSLRTKQSRYHIFSLSNFPRTQIAFKTISQKWNTVRLLNNEI